MFHTRTWTYSPARNECYLHQFTPHQPDLNYRNPAVRNAMLGHARFWFQQGIDGLRVDAIHVYETEGLTNEVYVNINGDRNSRANLILTSSINRVSQFLTST